MKVSWLDYVGLVRGINVGAGNRISMADFRAVFEGLGFTSVTTLLQSGNVVFRSDRHLAASDVESIERAFEAKAGFAAGFVVLSAGQFAEVLDANPLLGVGSDLSKLVVTFLPQFPDARPAPLRAADASPGSTPAAGQVPVDPGRVDPGLADPGLPDPVLADPGLADPGLPDPVLADPVLADPGLPDPVLADPVLADPGLADPAPVDPVLVDLQLPDADAILPEVFATGPHAVYSWHPDGISKSRVPPAFWKQLGPVYTARNVNTTNKLHALLADRRNVGGSA